MKLWIRFALLALPAIALTAATLYYASLPVAPAEKVITAIPQRLFPPAVLVTGIAAATAIIFVYLFIFRIKPREFEHARVHHPKEEQLRKQKLLFVVLDGAADRPSKALAGKTPYQTAHMPNMSSLTTLGQLTRLRVLPGMAPESDEAVLALLGYDPHRCYTGRGVLEAEGLEMQFKEGDLALRANFAFVDGGRVLDARAGGLTTDEAKQLAAALDKIKLKDVKAEFRAGVGYRGVLVLRLKGRKLSANISNTHPGYVREPGSFMSRAVSFETPEIKSCEPLDSSSEASTSANLVNAWVREAAKVLSAHPLNKKRAEEGKALANYVLLRDASDRKPRLFDLSLKYGLDWAIVADMPVERGIGKLAGMSVVRVPEMTGDVEKDYELRASKTLEVLKKFDCVYVHLKGPDSLAHAGNAVGKARVLEAIDKSFFGMLLKAIDLSSTFIVITSDHATSSATKAHTADPVPLAIYAPGIPAEGLPLNEKTAAHSSSRGFVFGEHSLIGTHLMPDIMRLMRHYSVKRTVEAKGLD